MFHPDTQFLIDHWTNLSRRAESRGGIPARAALEPDVLGLRLPRTFMAERARDDAVVRLAGGWIEGFHGEALKGRSLLSLWRTPSRPLVSTAPIRQLFPILARPSTTAPMPMSVLSPISQLWSMTICPTVTPSPMVSGSPGSE